MKRLKLLGRAPHLCGRGRVRIRHSLFFFAKITMVIMKKRKENIIMKKTKTRKLSERPITKKEIRKFMEEKSFEKGQVYWLSLLQKTRGES